MLVMGQGPIGLMFTMLVKRTGARVAATDTMAERLDTAGRCGAEFAWNPLERDVPAEVKAPDGWARRGHRDCGRVG